jgi:hypothetical protein
LLDIVQEIGALAGWAAGVGLAVLWVLHRSQARDLRRLREWATRAQHSGRDVPAVPPRAVPQQSAIRPSRRHRRIRARHVAVAVVGVLVLGGAATYGVSRLTGDDGGNAQAKGSPDKPRRNVAAVEPGDVSVAVLNGTTVPGLAAALRGEIAAAGFTKGAIDDFSDKQVAESVVQYAPGHEAEAKAVGRRLGISEDEPVTADTRALAGDATVVVIAGADTAP